MTRRHFCKLNFKLKSLKRRLHLCIGRAVLTLRSVLGVAAAQWFICFCKYIKMSYYTIIVGPSLQARLNSLANISEDSGPAYTCYICFYASAWLLSMHQTRRKAWAISSDRVALFRKINSFLTVVLHRLKVKTSPRSAVDNVTRQDACVIIPKSNNCDVAGRILEHLPSAASCRKALECCSDTTAATGTFGAFAEHWRVCVCVWRLRTRRNQEQRWSKENKLAVL